MGVPAFFRWLIQRYPSVIVEALADDNSDLTGPNPNGMEFDNLYLDMNGIIHPCCHPEDGPQPETERDMFEAMFEYIDHLFSVVRPRKLLYLAIDGVAPRAKMNQQRSRRFKVALELEQQAKSKRKNVGTLGESGKATSSFDSNVITPGTSFMARVGEALRGYVLLRKAQETAWRDVRVILSDASVPGEGEHKAMDFIRRHRAQDGYDPNTRHVVYGLDADLIFLGLCTHEPHFFVIRENVLRGGKAKRKSNRPEKGGDVKELDDSERQKVLAAHLCGMSRRGPKLLYHNAEEADFHLLRVSALREYLLRDFACLAEKDVLKFPFDEERILDDFVLLCTFAGNDFLPYLPGLDIRKKALPMLMEAYKTAVKHMNGYIMKNGIMNLSRVLSLLRVFSRKERDVYARCRRQLHKKKQSRRKTGFEGDDLDGSSDKGESNIGTAFSEEYKAEYYADKFGDDYFENGDELVKDMSIKYVEGLAWCMKYYYQGCPSWRWFYPYHYAPFASDIADMDKVKIGFELGSPLKPLEQLMAVLPPLSRHCLPKAYQRLMVAPNSPLISFYPSHVRLDKNGRFFNWEAVALLPFIEESEFLKVIQETSCTLSAVEKKRNTPGSDLIFLSPTDPLARLVEQLNCESSNVGSEDTPTKLLRRAHEDLISNCGSASLCKRAHEQDATAPTAAQSVTLVCTGDKGKQSKGEKSDLIEIPAGAGFPGFLQPPSFSLPKPGDDAASQFPYNHFPLDTLRTVLYAAYDMPPSVVHKSKLLKGVVLPPPVLSENLVEWVVGRNETPEAAQTPTSMCALYPEVQQMQACRRVPDSQPGACSLMGGLGSLLFGTAKETTKSIATTETNRNILLPNDEAQKSRVPSQESTSVVQDVENDVPINVPASTGISKKSFSFLDAVQHRGSASRPRPSLKRTLLPEKMKKQMKKKRKLTD